MLNCDKNIFYLHLDSYKNICEKTLSDTRKFTHFSMQFAQLHRVLNVSLTNMLILYVLQV